jgi:hypothetical protein
MRPVRSFNEGEVTDVLGPKLTATCHSHEGRRWALGAEHDELASVRPSSPRLIPELSQQQAYNWPGRNKGYEDGTGRSTRKLRGESRHEPRCYLSSPNRLSAVYCGLQDVFECTDYPLPLPSVRLN